MDDIDARLVFNLELRNVNGSVIGDIFRTDDERWRWESRHCFRELGSGTSDTMLDAVRQWFDFEQKQRLRGGS